MATITLHEANRYSVFAVSLAQYYGTRTATTFEVINDSGILIEANTGTGFTYSLDGFINGGTINEIYEFSASGALSFSATDLSLAVSIRNASVAPGKSSTDFYRVVMQGNDLVTGSAGADLIFGSEGSDTIDGGAGYDVLYYGTFDSMIVVDLAAGTAQTAFGTSTVTGIEDVIGTARIDQLYGNSGRNLLQGGRGDDLIDGRGSRDTASYQDSVGAVTVDLAAGTATGTSGSDTLVSIERVIGSRYDDALYGTALADTFAGSAGNDTIDGRDGQDWVEFANVGRGVTVDLAAGTTTGGAGNDILTSIENIQGSALSDLLLGSDAVNRINGNGGNDWIAGGAGKDVLTGGTGKDELVGGPGNDTLTGGAGKDLFIFESPLLDVPLTNCDRITDFSPTDDTIGLYCAIFTATGAATGPVAAENFKVIVTGDVTDADDYLIYNRSTGGLFYDPTGGDNGLADAVRFAILGKGLALTAADFVWI